MSVRIVMDGKNASPVRTVLYVVMALASLAGAVVIGASTFFDKLSTTKEGAKPAEFDSSGLILVIACGIAALMFFLMAVARMLTSDD